MLHTDKSIIAQSIFGFIKVNKNNKGKVTDMLLDLETHKGNKISNRMRICVLDVLPSFGHVKILLD